MLAAVVRLIRNGRSRDARLYLTANSGSALALTALLAFTGKSLGYQLFLHHHNYVYIERYSRLMGWIDRRIAPEGYHIVHCPTMADEFRRRYRSNCGFINIYPSIAVLDFRPPRTSIRRPFCVGHLSNLSFPKGLDLVIGTFQALKQAGHEVRLTLAGPCMSSEAQRLVEQVVTANPDSVEHLGPVYGETKRQFFDSIDVFLLPTRNESWGIVVNEALAASVPVIAFDRGCLRTVVGGGAGLVVDRYSDFVEAAAREIERWIRTPEEYSAASLAAMEQAGRLHRQGQSQLANLVRQIFAKCG